MRLSLILALPEGVVGPSDLAPLAREAWFWASVRGRLRLDDDLDILGGPAFDYDHTTTGWRS